MDEKMAGNSALEHRFFQLLSRRHRESKLRNLKASPPGSVDFSSNDFLSLSTSVQLRHDYIKELQHHASRLGSTGSRLLDGNSELAESLERELAAFHGGEAGLLTNSGFDANVSLFSCLPQSGDIVVYDELIHASVHDGMRQSRARKCISFTHNCLTDLRKKLQICRENYSEANVFIAVESVYSMEGDLAPLSSIVTLVEALFPAHNAHIIVDEAHATGIYGPNGRGRVSELGLESRIFARLHTFGKALACNGAVIICSALTRLYLLNYARPLIYTTFLSHPNLLAIKLVYKVLASDQTTTLTSNLDALISTLHSSLHTLIASIQGVHRRSVPEDILAIAASRPQSPIFALLTKHPRSLAKHCQDHGFVVRAVVPPTVPEHTERVRVCLHAGNTADEVQRFVHVVGEWVECRMAELDQESTRDGGEQQGPATKGKEHQDTDGAQRQMDGWTGLSLAAKL